MKYSAIMIDIIDSKKLSNSDREDIQIYIKKCLMTLNELFKPSLVFDVVFSAGDEVQGLFKNPIAAYLYFRLLKLILDPVQIRCGIGIGEWEVKIKEGVSTEQDGSAFHNARDAILEAHKKNKLNILYKSESKSDLHINTLISTSYDFSQRQTKQQKNISLLIELISPFYSETNMNIDVFKELILLLEKRDLINYFKLNSIGLEDNKYTLISEEYYPINFQEKLYQSEKIYNDTTLIKGIASKLSDILGTTRQNIEKSIRSSNIEIIRNLDLTALIFIYNNYWG